MCLANLEPVWCTWMLLHSWWSPKLMNGRGPSSFGISHKWRRARPRTLPGQSLLECVRLPQIKSTSPQQSCLIWDSVPDGSLQWSSSCLVWFPWWLYLTKFETYARVTPQKLDGCMWRWPWRWVWRIRVSWRWVWRKGRRWSWRSIKVSVKVSVTTK